MIETLFRQRFADPEEWFEKVTRLSSAGQQPRRKAPVLERICEIVSRLDQSTGKRIRLPPGTAATHRRFRQSASGFRVGSEVTTEGRSNGTAHFTTDFSELRLRPEAGTTVGDPNPAWVGDLKAKKLSCSENEGAPTRGEGGYVASAEHRSEAQQCPLEPCLFIDR
ncbi:hypothetical protein [Bradyrhizobium japonicum]|uniref:hypothetical protein n=1 Tax=Bradyrhizobium japonicum TaxID=375 RepID=UPI0027148108|nr:hypothetical protein [Bradyrhizobium japonicum]WLB24215.1 hypothetical protein QIH95_47450 [Bradyrhizobium japonicum]